LCVVAIATALHCPPTVTRHGPPGSSVHSTMPYNGRPPDRAGTNALNHHFLPDGLQMQQLYPTHDEPSSGGQTVKAASGTVSWDSTCLNRST
jgi:hypothetical protein